MFGLGAMLLALFSRVTEVFSRPLCGDAVPHPERNATSHITNTDGTAAADGSQYITSNAGWSPREAVVTPENPLRRVDDHAFFLRLIRNLAQEACL